MVLPQTRKQEIIKQYARDDKDTGSVEVQVAVLTEKINILTKHCQDNAKDFHSRRGLLKMVGKRRRLLNYIHKNDNSRYASLIAALGLRK